MAPLSMAWSMNWWPSLFSPRKRNEETVLLHSPRVIRDAFHVAIKRPEDLARRNGGDESFELHEERQIGRKTLNGARHWLRQLVPR